MLRLPFLAALALMFVTPALGFDAIDSVVPTPAQVHRLSGCVREGARATATVDAKRTDLGDEGYEITCGAKGCRITARTQQGLYYARQTLTQISAAGTIPCCKIVDKPRMRMRAVMFDLARLKEKHEYYYAMIDQLAKWKINTVFLHLTDGNACAIEIKRYPRMATPYAFAQEEMKSLIRYAQERHVELIPEIESWGHASYIAGMPDFADLGEDGPGSLCTSNPRTWEVLANIYAEMAALFPSKYLHAGCDESNFGKCPLCKAKMAGGAHVLVGEHIRRVCELVKAAGKVPMIWGDMLLLNRQAADAVPKDTIICNWDYKAPPDPEKTRFFKSSGFEVVGCPALVWGGRMLIPAPDTFDNIAEFAKIVSDAGCLGMETTVWIPQRYIADTLPFGLAYACEMSWSSRPRSRVDFAMAFAKSFFGMEPNREIADALWNVHQVSTTPGSLFTSLWDYRGQLVKLSTPELTRHTVPGRDRAKAVAEVLRRHQRRVTIHQAEYGALVLAADAGVHMGSRAVSAATLMKAISSAEKLAAEGKAEKAAAELKSAADPLEGLIAQQSAIAKRLDAAWDRRRYPDDPKRSGSGQNLLKDFHISGGYMKAIIAQLRAAQDQVRGRGSVDREAILKEPAREE